MRLSVALITCLAVFEGTVSASPHHKRGFLDRLLGGNDNGNEGGNGGGENGNSNGSGNENASQSSSQTTGSTRNGNGAGNSQGETTGTGQTGQMRVSTATDGSTIIDMTANINNLPIRFKVSAPADQFMANTSIPGAAATSSNGTNGLNVLLHGDGGQSFFDFPNQAVQGNLMGVVALAPNQERFWGGGQGLQRTDGAEHSAAVNSLIQDVLPQMVSFDKSQVFFTGVSGGSLMLSGFFVPAFMSQYKTGVELNCGALTPQVDFVDQQNAMNGTRIHFQSTQQELSELQPELPRSIKAYEQAASQVGLSDQQINQQMTVDNSPNGGHCEFDGQDFVSGVQLMASNYASVMQGGNGNVQGIGQVTNGVVGNENLQFTGSSR